MSTESGVDSGVQSWIDLDTRTRIFMETRVMQLEAQVKKLQTLAGLDKLRITRLQGVLENVTEPTWNIIRTYYDDDKKVPFHLHDAVFIVLNRLTAEIALLQEKRTETAKLNAKLVNEDENARLLMDLSDENNALSAEIKELKKLLHDQSS